jgi:hypothetical protein
MYNLGHAADGCDTAATHLRWLAGDARDEHGLEPDQWLSPEQCARLLRLATLADLLAADARAVLGEVAPLQALALPAVPPIQIWTGEQL